MANDPKRGNDTRWKPEEKTPDPEHRDGNGKAAGEAEPKGRPHGEREATETAAGRIEKPQPSRRR
ncbi:hypothetical protein [Siccirubricoccus phaeus]|uniref:hypothetical protein n=1 Tax=Siccirubricoccus phaeus TaxID=2595053 RepID=UPI0011F28AEE|nr:hypothetical protein [Siccirubricoccus phaeus]